MSKYQAGLESSSPGVTWNKPDSNTTSNLQQLIQHYIWVCVSSQVRSLRLEFSRLIGIGPVVYEE